MKKIICLLILLTALSANAAMAQDSIKKRSYLGIELSYQNPRIFKDGFLPALTFSQGKHQIYAGPQLMYLNTAPQAIWGAQAGYRFFPNGSTNRFNLFFDYNFSFLKGSITEEHLNNHSYWEFPKTRTTQLLSLDNYLGFGFQLKILKNLYASTAIGVGVGFYKEEYTYTYSNNAVYIGSGDLRLRRSSEINHQLKIGLGYKFGLRR